MAAGGGGFTPLADDMSIGWINILNYGAAGNGSTDDTAAVTAAIAALPSTGGVLYFPPGTYKTSGGFTLQNPVTVLGMGAGGIGGSGTYDSVSKITCTSQTANLFTISSPNVIFDGLAFYNTYVGTPTAGAAIATQTDGTSSGDNLRITDCLSWGFYDGIAITNGFAWRMTGTHIQNPVHRGLIVRNDNVANGTGGDWTIDGCWWMAGARSASTAQAINILGASGGKVSKIDLNGDSGAFWDYGVVLQPTSGLSGYLDSWHFSDMLITGTKKTCLYVGASGTNVHRVLVANSHFNGGWNSDTSQAAVQVDATGGTISHILMTNCTFVAETANSHRPIELTSVDNVRITGCLSAGYAASVVTQTGCSDVVVTASA